ncbi:MAG TPA: AAA family ATPase [Aggregatilineales bacterium]|nr:AAA family ATPase [Chloroflexota bacterium]HOA25379.1 AAA family ATPase [Aggregatilineales bacterium]HPV08179.1 AAA family ATPase [Aggregatilineales bacterium]HQA66983.1 AAA family ATPase [Aggregatilineales bacterium]
MLTRVSIQNYKSLRDIDVELGPLTVLVGQNSTGKSNFIDALRFVSDAVTHGLDQALLERGGIKVVQYASQLSNEIGINFLLQFEFEGNIGEYRFNLSTQENEYEIVYEKAAVNGVGYEVQQGKPNFIGLEQDLSLPWNNDRLRLFLPVSAGVVGPLGKIRFFLMSAGYYSIFPNDLRSPQRPSIPERLFETAFNLNSVLRRMKKETPDAFERLRLAFVQMVPGVQGIDVELIGGYLVTKLQYQYGDRVETFDLSQESDGTLRLLGILTALYQVPTPPLITIEEPELAVHPGALKMLYEVLEEASHRTQLIITTHSPDLISYCAPENLRIVEKVEGATKIAPLEQRQIDIVNEQLFSTSDLLRIEGLRPERPN